MRRAIGDDDVSYSDGNGHDETYLYKTGIRISNGISNEIEYDD